MLDMEDMHTVLVVGKTVVVKRKVDIHMELRPPQ